MVGVLAYCIVCYIVHVGISVGSDNFENTLSFALSPITVPLMIGVVIGVLIRKRG